LGFVATVVDFLLPRNASMTFGSRDNAALEPSCACSRWQRHQTARSRQQLLLARQALLGAELTAKKSIEQRPISDQGYR
jgi:hypothetical protein